MGILRRIKRFLKTKNAEDVKRFEDILVKRYGFKRYLFATSEGLPIMGNFNGYEELSAKAPELFKVLSELELADKYMIIGDSRIFLLLKITSEVLLLAEVSRALSSAEAEKLVKETKEELGL